MDPKDTIYVQHCCGAFGFDIPWASWMCENIYPTRNWQTVAPAARVYIYSIKGQLGNKLKEEAVTPLPEFGPSINVDAYINELDLLVDWVSVKAKIFTEIALTRLECDHLN